MLAALLAGSSAAWAAVQWSDVAAAAGIAFHQAGEVHPAGNNTTWPAFPEIMGGGACWADFNGDGYDDLYLVKQQYNTNNPAVGDWAKAENTSSRLYINQGNGTFADRTAASGVATDFFAYGCSAADYDGDGCVDLFVTGFGASRLFHNGCDGTFANATAALHIPFRAPQGCGKWPCMSTSSAWADYDHDGRLDLYVGNYVNTNLTDNARGPVRHTAQVNWLFHNDGNGTFTEVADAAGAAGSPTDDHGSKTLGVVWTDVNRDGWPDLYVANDEEPANLYVNQRDGSFLDLAVDQGVADSRANMGVAAADYDNDGWPDLFVSHYALEENGLYRNNHDGSFTDRSGEADLKNSFPEVGWGDAFVDVDRDGRLDLVVANGHTEWAALDYNQSLQVFRSAPNLAAGAPSYARNWTDVTRLSGPGPAALRVHRGAAFSDADLDGGTDIALNNNGNQSAQLLRSSGVPGHWLDVKLRQDGDNRFGVGARIVLDAAGLEEQVREVQAGSSYLSQNSLTQSFGLAGAAQADTVTVEWPGGGTTTVRNVTAGQTIRIDRSTGSYVTDTIAPRTDAVVSGTPGQSGWWRSAVTATLRAEDRGTGSISGLAGTAASVDGGAWSAYQGQAFALGEGVHPLRMRSWDRAGNSEQAHQEDVRVDLTPPAVAPAVRGTAGTHGWWVSDNVSVSLPASDALSGVREVRYRVDDGAWTTYAGPFTLTDDGVHRVAYAADDVAGNEAQGSVEVKLDHTPPAVRVTNPKIGTVHLGDQQLADAITGPAVIVATPGLAGLGGAEHTVAADARDATSGMDHVDFLLDAAVVARAPTEPWTWRWDTTQWASGAYVLEARAVDAAGNQASDKVRVILVSGTEEGVLATVEHGPSVYLGLGPLQNAPPGWPPASPADAFLADVSWPWRAGAAGPSAGFKRA